MICDAMTVVLMLCKRKRCMEIEDSKNKTRDWSPIASYEDYFPRLTQSLFPFFCGKLFRSLLVLLLKSTSHPHLGNHTQQG